MAAAEPGGARRRALAGVGHTVLWSGGSLWIGREVGEIPAHAHHAIQLSLALEGSLRMQAAAWPDWRACRGSLVMPDRPHRFDGGGATLALVFVEPNSRPGAALRACWGQADATLLPDARADEASRFLRDRLEAGASDEEWIDAARSAICSLAGDAASAPAEDPRITAALAWMRARLATPLRLEDVAKAVHLSPGRFRHLFVAQTGTAFRAWLLWARAEQAVAAANGGASWTEAAQAAGFADAAHFSRTCRRTFGVAPSMLAFARPRADAAG